MSYLLYFTAIFLQLFITVEAIVYEDLLQQISDGTFKEDRVMGGTLVVDQDPGYGADLNVSVHSFDKFAILLEAYTLYEHALAGSKWGDAVILSEFIYHNGVIDNNTLYGDIGNSIIERSKNNLTTFDIWQNTTTNANLRSYYASLQKEVELVSNENYIDSFKTRQFSKRSFSNQQQILKFEDSTIEQDCKRLEKSITSIDKDENSKKDIYSLCLGSCCLNFKYDPNDKDRFLNNIKILESRHEHNQRTKNSMRSDSLESDLLELDPYSNYEIDHCCGNLELDCKIFGWSIKGQSEMCLSNKMLKQDELNEKLQQKQIQKN